MKIPTEYNGEVHFYYSIKYGWIQMSKTKWDDEDSVCLGSTTVSVQFGDVREKAAEAIDAQITSVRAELEHRIQVLQGQKASLLAIECDK